MFNNESSDVSENQTDSTTEYETEHSSSELGGETQDQKSMFAAKEEEGSTEEDTQDNDGMEQHEEYKPNYKYKVLGKEMELPENIREYIKDADTEKFFRELHEKAGAVEHFKGKTKYLTDTQKELQSKVETYDSSVNKLKALYQAGSQSGDLDDFFKELNIPDEVILKHAVKKAQYYQMPEEERQRIDYQRQQEMHARQQQEQVNQQLTGYQTYIQNIKQKDIESTLQNPEIMSYAEEFDKRAGKPNAFLQELVRRGGEAWDSGKDLTAQEVAKDIMNFWRITPTATEQTGQTARPTGVVPQKKQPQVLPNMGGRSSAPVKTGPRSVDDLRKMIRERQS